MDLGAFRFFAAERHVRDGRPVCRERFDVSLPDRVVCTPIQYEK